MDEEFEVVILTCGHSINSNSGIGMCSKCKQKKCGKCLQWTNDKLLCPRCFAEHVSSGETK